MTGSLQIKNDKYYIIVNLKENGKRKQKWIATGLDVKGNKRKAEQLLRETLLECERAPARPVSNILFADYIRAWLKVAERRVDSVTFQGYKLMANAQVIPYFDQSGLLLQEVTRSDLQAFFDEKAARGRKDGKGGLSPSSLRQYKNIILQTLNEAVKNGMADFAKPICKHTVRYCSMSWCCHTSSMSIVPKSTKRHKTAWS